MSKIEDELITKECYAMQEIILENFTREAKWLYFQMDIVKYLKDKGINLVCDYEQKIKDLQSQLDQANERLKGAIVPKFKIGQEVYKVYTKDQRFPFKVKIIGVKITQTEEKISVLCDTEEDGIEMGWYPEKILFETLEEAEKKLQELRGGE